MTLALNHRQLLNGSSILLALSFLVLLSSCDLFRSAQSAEKKKDKDKKVTEKNQEKDEELDVIEGKVVYDPRTGTYDTVRVMQEKLDTVIWTDARGKDIPPPITSDGTYTGTAGNGNTGGQTSGSGQFGTQYFSTYNVSLMLPFLADRVSIESAAIPDNSLWAVHYYSGAKMALDMLRSEGVGLNLSVLDNEANEQQTSNLLTVNRDIQDAHLVIGPYRKDNVKQVAVYAKQQNKTFVSPYSASSDIDKNNPNYVQVSPTLDSHLEAIVQHARNNYAANQIVLVVRNKGAEVSRLKVLQNKNHEIDGSSSGPRLKEYVVEDQSADYGGIDVKPYLQPTGTTVFIVPSWSNDVFIGSLLRKLYIEARGRQVVVYGMPQWRNFTNIDYDYYENLNVHISSASFIDSFSPAVQDFKRNFFERYGVAPRDEAFLGYDVMLYFGRMLKKHGTKFQFFLDQEWGDGYLQTQFQFDRIFDVDPEQPIDDRLNAPIERFENKYVNILKFDNYFFQLAD